MCSRSLVGRARRSLAIGLRRCDAGRAKWDLWFRFPLETRVCARAARNDVDFGPVGGAGSDDEQIVPVSTYLSWIAAPSTCSARSHGRHKTVLRNSPWRTTRPSSVKSCRCRAQRFANRSPVGASKPNRQQWMRLIESWRQIERCRMIARICSGSRRSGAGRWPLPLPQAFAGGISCRGFSALRKMQTADGLRPSLERSVKTWTRYDSRMWFVTV